MRITVISNHAATLADLERLLRHHPRVDDVDVATFDQLAGSRQWPDILIVDRPDQDRGELAAIEKLANLAPAMAIIVLCHQQSPQFLLQAMRAGVREVLPFPPVSASLLPALERLASKFEQRSSAVSGEGKVLAFISCKGGSGATFIASNLGYALAASGKLRVALIDLNLHFGDASLFVSESKPLATLSDLTRDIHRLDPSFLASSMLNILPNYSVLAAPEDPAHASEVLPEHIDAIIKLARRQYDFIVLDVGRNLDAVSVRTLDHADMIFPILQTTLPYIRDGKRLLGMFRSLEYDKDKVHLIVNRHDKGGEIRLQDLEAAYGTTIYRTVPNHYASAAASVNQGVPILKLDQASPITRSLREFATVLSGHGEPEHKSWLQRLRQRH
ncbi:AAA family ATPase [Janthinobacterium aquaticum]|uniref:AAA family ATPase n=1 Tax=Janthinobacterium sp. FT58W TaxID=2654254 RepID=UPI0012646500|nr:AAA family ATPase [Janthinobacterium sp. FT58W]KAB8042814.1 AAA family ATPase [Janthinobacterium sp. FT58W]